MTSQVGAFASSRKTPRCALYVVKFEASQRFNATTPAWFPAYAQASALP